MIPANVPGFRFSSTPGGFAHTCESTAPRGRTPSGRVSIEIVHQVDLFPTLARIAAELPKDRILDGVDQTDILPGKQEKSNPEGVLCHVAEQLHAVKWRNWKVHVIWQEYMDDRPQRLPNCRVHNLIVDPRGRRSVASQNTWVYHPVMEPGADFEASLQREPPIAPGTPDPW